MAFEIDPNSQNQSRRNKLPLYVFVILALALLVIGGGIVKSRFRNKALQQVANSVPQPAPAESHDSNIETFGSQIYAAVEASSAAEPELPDTNPIGTQTANPISEVYQNPFE